MNKINNEKEQMFLNEPWKKVLEFWFSPENKPYWFEKSEVFDNEIYNNFYEIWQNGCQGLLSDWRVTLHGRLAEIIVLDQFSRNLCREDSCSFTQDGMALVLAQEAIKQPEYNNLSQDEKKFLLMPFMHSESSEIHKQAIILFEELGDIETTKYEYLHKEIIDRYGRYPHRNDMLNRKSTLEEIEFLKQPGSSF